MGSKQEAGETNQDNKQGDDWEQVREKNLEVAEGRWGRSFRAQIENTWHDKTCRTNTSRRFLGWDGGLAMEVIAEHWVHDV